MSAVVSLAVYFLVVVLLIGLLMLVTHLSGERHFELGTGIPYESGRSHHGLCPAPPFR